nr:hypothetical protein [Pseudomonadota bacterium]
AQGPDARSWRFRKRDAARATPGPDERNVANAIAGEVATRLMKALVWVAAGPASCGELQCGRALGSRLPL